MTLRASIVAVALALLACGESAEPEPPAASTGGEVAPPTANEPMAAPAEAPALAQTRDVASVPGGTPTTAEVSAPATAEEPVPLTAAGPVGPPPLDPATSTGTGPAASPTASPAREQQARAATTSASSASSVKPAPATPASPASPAPSPARPPPTAAGTPAQAAAPTPANAPGRVIVDIQKLEHDKGKIQAALFRGEAGFPDNPAKAAMRKMAKIANRRVDLTFEDVPPGEFAVLVHHDENGDSKMQTGLFGQPAEGYAISRDAPANFGPPSYEDARLVLKPGETKRVVVKMRY